VLVDLDEDAAISHCACLYVDCHHPHGKNADQAVWSLDDATQVFRQGQRGLINDHEGKLGFLQPCIE